MAVKILLILTSISEVMNLSELLQTIQTRLVTEGEAQGARGLELMLASITMNFADQLFQPLLLPPLLLLEFQS